MQYYILDSDHLSLHQRGFEPLKQKLLSLHPDKLGISIVSVEELSFSKIPDLKIEDWSTF
jgi:predicted nucleic acid-binding protein